MKRLSLLFLFGFLISYIPSTFAQQSIQSRPTALQQQTPQGLTELQQPERQQLTDLQQQPGALPQSQLELEGQEVTNAAQQPTALQQTGGLTELQQPVASSQQPINRKILFNPSQITYAYKITYIGPDNSFLTGELYPGSFAILESDARQAYELALAPIAKEGVTPATWPSQDSPPKNGEFLIGPLVLNANYFFIIHERGGIASSNPLPDGAQREQQFKELEDLTKFKPSAQTK